MNKILLIIQREYFSRVKKKSFILLTLLVPVLFVGTFGLIGYLAAKQGDLGDTKKILVVDESGIYKNNLKNAGSIQYVYTSDSYATAKTTFQKAGNDYLLHIPATEGNAQLLSEKKASAITISNVEDQLSQVAQAHRLKAAGIDTAMLAKAQARVSLDARQITATGEKDAETYVAYAIGFLAAFLIYMSLLIYGSQVMRGVIEEKTSRIIEIIISSVKPFQLMLGKIIGVGLVGLTQFVIWIVISTMLSGTVGGVMMSKMHPATTQAASAQHPAAANAAATTPQPQNDDMSKVMHSLSSIPVAYTLGCFLFYFLFGYFLYSAIFAAVGSAVDSETETQQFVLPITLPLIFSFILSMNYVINNPDSSLSVWLSMIPFTSPIVMMIRIPFGVPGWQLALSMALLGGGFLFTTWVAGRIYRVGILMYGKKASYKELAKWFFYKD